MKTYIFLTRTINKIGGTQLYLSSKIRFLEENGWDCHVFFREEPDNILIPNLRKYSPNWIYDLRMPIANISRKASASAIEYMVNKSGYRSGDEIIIESQCLRMATWGEYLAQKLSVKHFVYFIDESICRDTPQMEDFIRYKISQGLFYCIKDEVLTPFIVSKDERKKHTLTAVGCSENNVVDIETRLGEKIPEDGKNIFSIGRLEKPYYGHMTDMVCHFAKSHSETHFNFVIIGDTDDERIRQSVFDKIKSIENIRLITLGYVWPLPRCLIKKASVILASAGSAYMGYLENIPTIAIDSNDFEAIGVVGYNTTNVLFRTEADEKWTIADYLKRILIDNDKLPLDLMIPKTYDYTKHIEIIRGPKPSGYYDVMKSRKMIKHYKARETVHRLSKSKFAKCLISKIKNIAHT